MQTNTKRMLSFLLALALILSLFPILPRAEAAGYQLWLGSVQVTDANKDHIPVNAGTASFDPATNTLTLISVGGFNGYSEVSIQVGMDSYETRSVLIKSEIPLTIKGDATVYDTADFGIYCGGNALTIDADLAFMKGCDILIDAGAMTVNGGDLFGRRCSNIARDFINVSSFTLNGGKVEFIATNAEIGMECYGAATFNGGTFTMKDCWDGIIAGTVQVKSPAELFVETKGIAVQADTINVTGSEITCPVEGKVWNQSFEEIEKDCMIGLPDCPNAADTVYIQDGCYPLYVGRYRVTVHNKDCIPLANDYQVAYYDPATKTLSNVKDVVGSWKLFDRERDVDWEYREAAIHADGMDLTVKDIDVSFDSVGSAVRQVGVEVSGGKLIIAGDVKAAVKGANSPAHGGAPAFAGALSASSITVKSGIALVSPSGGTWDSTVYNSSGSVSKTAEFKVSLPKITGQPQNASVALGASATFKVTATGFDLGYQWQYKKAGESAWQTFPGKTAASMSVTASATNGGCQYRCEVWNPAGSVFSNAVTLTVTAAGAKPTITTQPKSASAAIGQSVTFKVVASGSGLKYQWQYKKAGASSWTAWSGKTAASLAVTASATNGGCQYRCVVSNSAGSVTSSAATLTVTSTGTKPTITAQPKSASAAVGQSVTFKVTASGSGLKYQWQFRKSGKTEWSNWAGKTSASLPVTASTTNNGCQYRCVVSNAAGPVNSAAAMLTVTNVPPAILKQPADASAAIGKTVTFTVSAAGSGVKYQWQYRKIGETTWHNWSGKTAASLSVTASATNNGCQYRCYISNSYGGGNSAAATLTVTNVKPAIRKHPANASVALGKSVTFSVTAVGSNLSYQWQFSKDGGKTWSNWSGKTAATLTVTGSATNGGCKYRCVVKNTYGSVTSNPATLTVK